MWVKAGLHRSDQDLVVAQLSRQDWFGDLEQAPADDASRAKSKSGGGGDPQNFLLAFMAGSLLVLLSAALAFGINQLESSGVLGVTNHPLQPYLVPVAYVLLGAATGGGIRLVGRGSNLVFGIMAALYTVIAAYLTVVLQGAFGLHELSADFLSGSSAGELGTITSIKLSFSRLSPFAWLANQGVADWLALVIAAVGSWWLSHMNLRSSQSQTALATR